MRVSSRELCPRLRKHILAEERNTIQAGRGNSASIQPPPRSFWLPTAAGVFTIGYWALYCYRLSFMCLFSVFYTSVLRRGKNGATPAWQGPEGRALRWGTGNPASLSCLSLSHCVALGHVTSLSAPAPLCHGVVPPNRALSACLLVFVLVKCLGGVFGDALPGRGRHGPIARGEPWLSTVLCPQSSRSRAQCGWRERWRTHHPALVAQLPAVQNAFLCRLCPSCPPYTRWRADSSVVGKAVGDLAV